MIQDISENNSQSEGIGSLGPAKEKCSACDEPLEIGAFKRLFKSIELFLLIF
ncbi:hypothetical protein PCH70_19540 [Pseudomonas cichorii JBC1]|uniref:Uncharacterized protein n=1 Tax=Pseudomonas cichorii TaxID=36746 RepID=A0ABQ1DHX7_PSECI|nr:hypothetical protein PCH70_19540 [Pseudomonas cichorii JBC1]GFM90605.1 hypothetical protein PSCICP_05770 [Pseudomonas cichorii]